MISEFLEYISMDKSSGMAVFVTTIEAGGFSAAARRLGQTPSAVTKHMARLEDRLRTRLSTVPEIRPSRRASSTMRRS
jgi:DNA-binding MarR family transcriptional regulator